MSPAITYEAGTGVGVTLQCVASYELNVRGKSCKHVILNTMRDEDQDTENKVSVMTKAPQFCLHAQTPPSQASLLYSATHTSLPQTHHITCD